METDPTAHVSPSFIESLDMEHLLFFSHSVVDTSSAILIKVKGYNLTRQNETFSTFVLQSNEIFDKLVESNTNGNVISTQCYGLIINKVYIR